MTGMVFDLNVRRNAIHVLVVTLVQWRFPHLDGRSQSNIHGVVIVTVSGVGKSDRLCSLYTSWPLLASSGSASGGGRSSAVAPNKSEAILSSVTLEDAKQP